MRILAIDPGTEMSGWVWYDSRENIILCCGITKNEDIQFVQIKHDPEFSYMAIEMIGCYGMPVGRETFETCVWLGRFLERWDYHRHYEVTLSDIAVYRREVKLHLCNSVRAKDSNVRQAILDKFPATGGGKTPQVGTKGQPGPLYGIKSHMWAALGVALCYADKHKLIDGLNESRL